MRFKYWLLVLVLLSACAVVISEETCVDKCMPECIKICPVKKTCSEDQIDCGAGPPRPSPHTLCEPDRICVAKNCQCPTKDTNGDDCPTTCDVQCGGEEQFCAGSRGLTGCKQPDQCVAKEKTIDGDLCPGLCPTSCANDQKMCTTPKEANGCSHAPACKAKGKDKNENDCSGVCPKVCKEDELLCTGSISENGCIEEDTCVTKGTDNSGGLCPGSCPVECKDSEVHCVGPLQPNGCRMADACHPKAKNANGEDCPANSDSHNCPVTCADDEVLCPAHQDALGCKEEAVCTKKTKDDKGDFCPQHSVCHSPCKTQEVSCAGGMDATGCKKPDICLARGRDYNGDLCPTRCPGDCNEDEIMCHGTTNSEGCKDSDVCVERGSKKCGPDVGGTCSGHCPVDCNANEIKCPSQLDPCDCCPTEEVCRPLAKDINGDPCDAESASHNCPRFCDEQAGEVLCPSYENQLGCKLKAMCMMRVKDNDGNNCPAHSVCPKQCGNDEILCGTGTDSNGCQNADTCKARGKDIDGNLCPEQCPPVCEENQVLCTGGIKGNGCKDIDVCVPKIIGKDGSQCVTVCPVTCTATQSKVSGGDDENGCPKVDICADPKQLGSWANEGACTGDGDDPTCGPGTQIQKRTCTDGTIEKCTEEEKQRSVTCEVAGTQLPLCGIQSVEVAENEEITLVCSGTDIITVVSAVYGKPPNCAADTSLSKVNELCQGKMSCKVKASNDVFGDPCASTTKSLKVSYACVANALACTDTALGKLTSQSVMEANGWSFDVGQSMNLDAGWVDKCGTNTWYGWTSNNEIGSATATLKGPGLAKLDYGNCFEKGVVNVYLNDVLISSAEANVKSKSVTFLFSAGDVLKLTEENTGIIKLNAMDVTCTEFEEMPGSGYCLDANDKEGTALRYHGQMTNGNAREICESDDNCVAYVYSQEYLTVPDDINVVIYSTSSCTQYCANTQWRDNPDLITKAGNPGDHKQWVTAKCYKKK